MKDFSMASWHDTTKYSAKTAILSTLKDAGFTPEQVVGHHNRINVSVREYSYQILIDEDTSRIRIFLFLDKHPVFDPTKPYGINCANVLNCNCIYAKFWMDKDGTIVGIMDLPATTLSSGYIATRGIMILDSGIDEIWNTIEAYLQLERERQ